jgi:hypothetical protein
MIQNRLRCSNGRAACLVGIASAFMLLTTGHTFAAVGDDCTDPIVVTLPADLTYIDNNTPLGHGNTYTGTSMGSYDTDEDIMYRLDVTEEVCVDITVTADTTWTGIGVFAGCPDVSPTTIAQATSTANPDVILGLVLAPGQYFLMVDTFPPPSTMSYELVIEPCQPGRCCYSGGFDCEDVTAPECDLLGGVFDADLNCTDNPCPIAPVNDTCQLAVEAFNGVNVGNNTGSLVDDPDPSCTSSGSSDIWFYYTATDSGSLLIDTCNTYLNPNNPEPVDTVLAVYDACGGAEYDCDDDCIGSSDPPAVCRDEPQTGTATRDSCVCIDFIEAGTTVWIQILGYGGDEGEIFLNITPFGCDPPLGACCVDEVCIGDTIEVDCAGLWFEGESCATFVCPTPPPNDDCDNAIVVMTMPFQDLDVPLNLASDDANVDPSCDSSSCVEANNGVWYQYTPPWNCLLQVGDITLDVATSIWTGHDCNSLTQFFCSDPDPFEVELVGGTTYWILISNWSCGSEPSGPIDVNFDCIPLIPVGACCIDDVCTVLPEADCLAASGVYIGDGTNCDLVDLGGIADPGYEGGTPNADWIEASTNFGTPLCDIASCGVGGGSGPYEGDWWCWLGGITGALEEASAQQDITIDATAELLRFYFEMPVSEGLATDVAQVQIDGNVVWEIYGDAALVAPYTPVDIDLATAPGGPYNDGGVHTLLITGTTNSVTGPTNFFFDSLVIGKAFVCPTEPDCPYDVTGPEGMPDGEVGVPDFFGLLQSWGPCPLPCPPNCDYDVTGPDGEPDCEVGVPDFFGLLQNWGVCE